MSHPMPFTSRYRQKTVRPRNLELRTALLSQSAPKPPSASLLLAAEPLGVDPAIGAILVKCE